MRAFFLVLLSSTPALAHKGSDAYWTLRAAGSAFTGRLDVALRDLDALVGLDGDGDGAITWGEVRLKEPALRTSLASALGISQASSPCVLDLGAFEVVRHSDGAYLAVPVSGRCTTDVHELDVRYGLLFDVDAQHRGLLSVGGDAGERWMAFTRSERTRRVAFASLGAFAQAGLAFAQGVHHIAIGWDHLCFLFALLLPSVLARAGRTWVPRPAFRPALLEVAKVVSAFTVAHSMTLGLAAFGLAAPDARWVEVAIAASVALAALNNLMPFAGQARWSLAFSLGLLHGFGFVAAIRDLGASGPSLWLSVLGFNLGVEAGQLAIVALFVPVGWVLRSSPVYRRGVLPLGSLAIFGVALWWTAERIGA